MLIDLTRLETEKWPVLNRWNVSGLSKLHIPLLRSGVTGEARALRTEELGRSLLRHLARFMVPPRLGLDHYIKVAKRRSYYITTCYSEKAEKGEWCCEGMGGLLERRWRTPFETWQPEKKAGACTDFVRRVVMVVCMECILTSGQGPELPSLEVNSDLINASRGKLPGVHTRRCKDCDFIPLMGWFVQMYLQLPSRRPSTP